MVQARQAGKQAWPLAAGANGGPRGSFRASALVIDDEAPALDELSYLLRTTFSITPVDAAQNSAEALRYLQERHYDVVFLDVRMPTLNGIELGNVLRRFSAPPAIVFVTAYEEYAVRAFEIGACDYLLKPVSRIRLRTALGRALARPLDQATPADHDDLSAMIPVETAGRTRFISSEQVSWVEAEGDYVRLHTTDGDAHLVRMPISHLEERWAAHGFVRVHRSYLVSFKRITEFCMTAGLHTVTVDGQSLPVSRRHVRDVRDRILRAGGRRSLPFGPPPSRLRRRPAGIFRAAPDHHGLVLVVSVSPARVAVRGNPRPSGRGGCQAADAFARGVEPAGLPSRYIAGSPGAREPGSPADGRLAGSGSLVLSGRPLIRGAGRSSHDKALWSHP